MMSLDQVMQESLTNHPLPAQAQKGYRTNIPNLPPLENIFGSSTNLSGIPLG